jgi:hypothetical protein
MRLSLLYRSVSGWLTVIIVAAGLLLGGYAWASGFSMGSPRLLKLGLAAVLALVGLPCSSMTCACACSVAMSPPAESRWPRRAMRNCSVKRLPLAEQPLWC